MYGTCVSPFDVIVVVVVVLLIIVVVMLDALENHSTSKSPESFVRENGLDERVYSNRIEHWTFRSKTRMRQIIERQRQTILIDEKGALNILFNKFSFEFEKFLKINFSMFMYEFSILSCCVEEIWMSNMQGEQERRREKKKEKIV